LMLGNSGSPQVNVPKTSTAFFPSGVGKEEKPEENLNSKGGITHKKLGRSPTLGSLSKFQINSTLPMQPNYMKHQNQQNLTHHNNASILNVTETTCHKSRLTGEPKEQYTTNPPSPNMIINEKPINSNSNPKKISDIIFGPILSQETQPKPMSNSTLTQNPSNA
jgi:hypothetical protein